MKSIDANRTIKLFLCGDVMIGRGIDQVLPCPGDPSIYESNLTDANGYVELAERTNGPIPRPVDFSYVWGDALSVLARSTPDLRIVNLETAVTESAEYWPGKEVNYRMHPDNVDCLTAAGIDCCALANNHVIDWGYPGLLETLATLAGAGVANAGAGTDLRGASAPAMFEVEDKGRVLVFSFGATSSGIPYEWAATERKPGVALLEDFSVGTARRIGAAVRDVKREGDIVVASIHWGGNWGYRIPPRQMLFAHMLIDDAGVDVIHRHSSHHPKSIEVYKGKLILYGCGDFINDYEGIRGYEEFQGDLSLMYLVRVDPSNGQLVELIMTPTRMSRFRVNECSRKDAGWLREMLNREGSPLNTRVTLGDDNRLHLVWA